MLDQATLQRHLRTLEARDESERRQAIRPLLDVDEQDWEAAPPQLVQSLVEALKRQLAAEPARATASREIVVILGKIGPRSKSAVAVLSELLSDKNPDVIREAVVVTLGKIGRAASSAVDRLVELSSSSRPALSIQTIRSIGSIGHLDERVRTTLVDLWRSSTQTPAVQVEVAIAVCKLGVRVPGLVASLTAAVVANQDAGIRKSAALALGWCDPNESDVVPGLLRAANADKNDDVRHAAEAALTRLGLSRKQAIRLCATQLAGSVHAEAALRLGGELAVNALITVLDDGDPDASEKAARVLGVLGELSRPAVPALRVALRSAHLEFRLAAAKSMWMITQEADEVTPVLVGLLREKRRTESQDEESRRRFLQTVIEALRRIGPGAKDAIPALVEKSKDKNRLISESALGALKEISPPRLK
jgi:HEAT repeat protein